MQQHSLERRTDKANRTRSLRWPDFSPKCPENHPGGGYGTLFLIRAEKVIQRLFGGFTEALSHVVGFALVSLN